MQGKKSSNKSYDGRGRGRTRNWTFLVYPTKDYLESIGSDYDGSDGYGSVPDNWRSVLDDYHVSWVESELHDKDINPDGTPKKPHWHILLLFDGVQSFEQVEEISNQLNGARPEKVKSVKGLIRYFGHLDNPEKYQYGLGGIFCHQGADLGEILLPSRSEKLNILNEIRVFIKDNDIRYFNDVLDYAAENKFDTWFDYLSSSGGAAVNNYLRGLSAKRKEENEKYFVGGENNAKR